MNISTKQLRNFGFLVGIGFPLIFGWTIPFLTGHSFKLWTHYIGIPIFILGIIKPSLLFFPYKLWMGMGYILGWINSRIILGVVFVVVLQPIALFMRFLNYDPLRKKWNNKKTYKEIRKNYLIDFKKIF